MRAQEWDNLSLEAKEQLVRFGVLALGLVRRAMDARSREERDKVVEEGVRVVSAFIGFMDD